MDIEAILKEFEGKLLADKVGAMGCIPIETTRTGIYALVDSKHIKVILEDQPISAILEPS